MGLCPRQVTCIRPPTGVDTYSIGIDMACSSKAEHYFGLSIKHIDALLHIFWMVQVVMTRPFEILGRRLCKGVVEIPRSATVGVISQIADPLILLGVLP